MPTSNRTDWRAKLANNKARDTMNLWPRYGRFWAISRASSKAISIDCS
jgi:hypothetical protein